MTPPATTAGTLDGLAGLTTAVPRAKEAEASLLEEFVGKR